MKATAWVATPGDERGAQAVVGTTSTTDAGYAELDVDTTRLLHGPATVRIDIDGVEKPLYVQLFNSAGVTRRMQGRSNPGG